MSEGDKRPQDLPWGLPLPVPAQDALLSPSPSKRPRIAQDRSTFPHVEWSHSTSAPASSASSNFPQPPDQIPHPRPSQNNPFAYPYPAPASASASHGGMPLTAMPTPHVASSSLNNEMVMVHPLPTRPASAAATMVRSLSLPSAGPSTSSSSLPHVSPVDPVTRAQSRQPLRSDIRYGYNLPFDVLPHPSVSILDSNPNSTSSMPYYGVSSSGSNTASSSGPSSAALSRHSSSRGVVTQPISAPERALSATPTTTTGLIPSMAHPYPPAAYPDSLDQLALKPLSSTPSTKAHPPHYSHHRLPLHPSQAATPTPMPTSLIPTATATPSPPLRSAIPSRHANLEPASLRVGDEANHHSPWQGEGKKGRGRHKGVPGPKARIPVEAKQAIGEHIIAKGVAMANVDELALLTGLTKQQIKSQLVDNRQNVRKQLTEFVRSLQ
ncbi:hypothetical protein I317_07576 [Kwoniella heveanensis CBS 569]|nr:hypothetical protein I317_07576 [Kwoniella heveanensis CBS 569]